MIYICCPTQFGHLQLHLILLQSFRLGLHLCELVPPQVSTCSRSCIHPHRKISCHSGEAWCLENAAQFLCTGNYTALLGSVWAVVSERGIDLFSAFSGGAN